MTNITTIWFLSGVGQDVILELARTCKALTTIKTNMWFLSCVGQHVILELV
jgi:hypothetical protein